MSKLWALIGTLPVWLQRSRKVEHAEAEMEAAMEGAVHDTELRLEAQCGERAAALAEAQLAEQHALKVGRGRVPGGGLLSA